MVHLEQKDSGQFTEGKPCKKRYGGGQGRICTTLPVAEPEGMREEEVG